jgi:hypothetical protein
MADAESEVRAEVERLTGARDELTESVEILTAWLESHRTQLARALLAAQQSLQQGLTFSSPPPVVAVDEVEAELPADTDDDAVIDLEDDAEIPEASEENEHDPFFDELRKAVQDTGPLGTIHDDPDDEDVPLFDQELVDARRSGSRLRRKR